MAVLVATVLIVAQRAATPLSDTQSLLSNTSAHFALTRFATRV